MVKEDLQSITHTLLKNLGVGSNLRKHYLERLEPYGFEKVTDALYFLMDDHHPVFPSLHHIERTIKKRAPAQEEPAEARK